MRAIVAALALCAIAAAAPAPSANALQSGALRDSAAPRRPIPPRVIVPDSAVDARIRRAADSAAAERVPPLRDTALLSAWGPSPPGAPHTERTRSYHLQHQIVHVRFDWSRHAVIGSTTLRVAPLDTALRVVALDAVGMTIGSVRATGRSAAPLHYTYDGSTLAVLLATPVAPRDSAAFTVTYETVAPRQGVFFIDRLHDLWTQGETESTRYWIPTYDYPNDKTTWEIYVRVPKGQKALSNGRLVGTTPVDGNVEWHWALDEPASTYLMTVSAGTYTILRDKWHSIPVDYWVYPDSVAAGWRGFRMTPHAIDVFSAKTGVPYPWPKYDQIVAPNFIFGGMENVTATTQNDNEILHPAWAEPQAATDGLVSHELAHQWYGDYLTPRVWANAWLNEGFATFMEQIFQEAAHGAAPAALERIEAQRQSIEADRRARRPIVYDRWERDPMELFFSGHIYPKGATVLQGLRHALGDSAFWAAMHRYTIDHARANVVTADLERAFEQTTGRDFSTYFKQWIYGAGFPVLQISATYEPSARTVTFTARQVQPRDSLTGYFDANVDVEVLTDSGAVRGIVPLHGALSSATLTVRAAPRSYRWDKGRWLLQLYDFPRSTAMLAYQLQHDDDVTGRLEAADLLGERGGDPTARSALAGATTGDAYWAVRREAATGLAAFGGDTTAQMALLSATRDSDSRVRTRAAHVLGAFPGADTEDRLRELVSDSSRFVRGAALIALAKLDTAAAVPLIEAALTHPSWNDIERHGALQALAVFRIPPPPPALPPPPPPPPASPPPPQPAKPTPP